MASETLTVFLEGSYLLFALTMALLWVLVVRWVRPEVLGRGVVAGSAVGVVVALIAGASVVAQGREAEVSQMRTQLIELAEVYARESELLGHHTVETDGGEPAGSAAASARARILEAQARWLGQTRLVADIYTVRREIGSDGTPRYRLVVDSETDYDHSGAIDQDREVASDSGELVDLPGVEPAFAGEAIFVDEPDVDRWGFWVSSHTPMRGPDGEVEAILGVDYPAEEWIQRLAGVDRSALLTTALVIVAGLAALSLYSLVRRGATTQVERARASGEQMAVELELARQFHRGLLSIPPPAVAGFDCSLTTNDGDSGEGESFDWLGLADGRFLLVMAHANGRPIGPMLMSTVARELTRVGKAPDTTVLQEVANRLREELMTDPVLERSTSTMIMLLDPALGTCSIVRSSRTPILLSAEKWIPSAEPVSGSAKGGAPEIPNTDDSGRTRILQPGESMVVLSDAAHEWLRTSGDLEGLSRLTRGLVEGGKSASELGRLVAQELSNAGGPPQGTACAAFVRQPSAR